MISTTNLTMQFGGKPLFENVSIRFGDGNRYGLIGANGCGKSTFMKILGGDLEPSAGSVAIDRGERLGKLRQDQFAYEDMRVLDVVLMGHAEMWQAMQARDAIYADEDASEDDYMRAAELEHEFAEFGGYTAEARASALLTGIGVPIAQHDGPMSAVAPGWKLRVLLAQALFGDPDILLLDEPTNHLDINTIRWLEGVLNERNSTMVIISHDRHFLSAVCTHMADVDYGEIRVYPGNYDDYMLAATQAREGMLTANAKAKERIADLQDFVRRFSANASKARQATSRARQIEKIKVEDIKPSSRVYPYIRFDVDDRDKLHRYVFEAQKLAKGYDKPLFSNFNIRVEAGERIAIIGPNGIGKTTLLRCLAGELAPDAGTIRWTEKAKPGYCAQDHAAEFTDKETLAEWLGAMERPQRQRPDRARGTRAAAVLGRRRDETDPRPVGRRAAAHGVRETGAPEAQRAADGRADQPPRHGMHRVAQHRARKIPGHADFRVARPRVRVLARHPHHRDDARGHHHPRRQLRRLPGGAKPRRVTRGGFTTLPFSPQSECCRW